MIKIFKLLNDNTVSEQAFIDILNLYEGQLVDIYKQEMQDKFELFLDDEYSIDRFIKALYRHKCRSAFQKRYNRNN